MPDQIERLDLPPTAAAPAVGRDLLAELCRRWDTPGLAEAASLATSELVTNAVIHADTDIALTVQLSNDTLTIAVRDGSGGSPRVIPVGQRGAAGGRGLALVAALVDEWGVNFEPGGKTVWCRLAVPTRQAASPPALREHASDLTPER